MARLILVRRGGERPRVQAPRMPGVSEWHRPYEVSWLRQLSLPVVVVFLVYLFLCFSGAPFAIGIRVLLLSPAGYLLLLVTIVFGWFEARSGVYVGDAGVMVRVGFRRVVLPWQEIAYTEVAEVPKYPVILQRGPSLALVLVAPSGLRHPLRMRKAAGPVLRWGRGSRPYVVLTHEQMTQVVNYINVLAARQRPEAWPPSGGWLLPPR